MTVEEYFGDWCKVVDVNMADSILKKLIASKTSCCPAPVDIFKAFRLCSYYNLRVVILGQDPYSDLRTLNNNGKAIKVPVATGIAFANSSDTLEEHYSPSLDVLRESVIDFTVPHRHVIFDPSLEKWEQQGVLLLNTALSCQTGRTGSHTLLWRPFTKSLLTKLSDMRTGIVYVLMGNQAISMESCINPRNNHIIKIRHPSYYARTNTRMPSDIWKEIDNILIGQNGYGIEWYKEY